ncbi:MAG TPA: hypothetical protein VG500_20845 [Gemmatimonadales bacterium]|jgi:hypothetical protein|nr:hypothetical protein [Gemmatimonadales bacterium]
MHATIRRYPAKSGSFDPQALKGLKQRVEAGFIPRIQDVRGFHGYFMMDVGNKELVTISLFEDRDGTTESTRRAAEFVRTDPMKDQLGAPEVIEGELLLAKEAALSS